MNFRTPTLKSGSQGFRSVSQYLNLLCGLFVLETRLSQLLALFCLLLPTILIEAACLRYF